MKSGNTSMGSPQSKGQYLNSRTPVNPNDMENANNKPLLSKRSKHLALLSFLIIALSVIAIVTTTASSNDSEEVIVGSPPHYDSISNTETPAPLEQNEEKKSHIECGKNLSSSTQEDLLKCDHEDNSKDMEKFIYRDINFDWKNPNNYEWADTSSIKDAVQAGKFQSDHILLDRKVRSTPIRTKTSWHGEKIVYVEWIASEASDTNIWMLNKKIHPQFGANNGWPYYGELDIFEMFNEDKRKHSHYDFNGFREFNGVSSYGQLTLHYGTSPEKPCFCPASHTKEAWYKELAPLTSGCTAQFKNTPNKKNSIATIFGSDSRGQYLQLIQNPVITKGKDTTYKIEQRNDSLDSIATPKIYNDKDLYWGTPVTECSDGHNPISGFPFFEEFRLIFEEQAAEGQFMVTDVRIFVP